MSAPNLKSPTTINGKVAVISLADVSVNSLLSNAASSGKCLKVEAVIVANDDGAASVDISLFYYSAAALGGTAYKVGYTITVPAKASVNLLDKLGALYLEEDRSLGVQASAANDADVVASYLDIS
jgi:hypothetical protein